MSPLTSDEVLSRARKAAEESKARYRLGKGGYDPSFPLPEHPKALKCDCSGFYAWANGIPRQTGDIRLSWIETTAVHHDATHTQHLFEKVTVPQAGDGIVYPDTTVNGKRRQGHIGVISEVVNGKVTKVIHCSTGNDRKFGKAIAETGPEVFTARKDTIYVRMKP